MNFEYQKNDNDINSKWLLIEKYTNELTEEEKKEIINKKLADLIIELENNPITNIIEEKGEYSH